MNKEAEEYWNNFLHDRTEIKLELFNHKKNDKSTKKNIFKKYVGVINLETSTYCNRKCSYCPLSDSDRGDVQDHMKDRMYKKVINDLQEINYNHKIMLNLYNEPLSDNDIFNKISIAREKLPEANIVFNSNGDFVTRDKLDKLAKLGNDAIFITLHEDKNYTDEKQLKAIEDFFAKIDLKYSISEFVPNKSILVKRDYKGMKIKVMSNNWNKHGNYRAGTVENLKTEEVRKKPCMKPIREFTISQNGNVYPCCNCFPGDDSLSEFIAGNINDNDIFDIYHSKVLVDFRRRLFDFSSKSFPCSFCSDKDNAELSSAEKRTKILKQAIK